MSKCVRSQGFHCGRKIKYRMEISPLWEWIGLGSTSGNPGFLKYGMCARMCVANSYSGARRNLRH